MPRRGGKSGPRLKGKRHSGRIRAIGQLDTTPNRHDQSPRGVQPQDPTPALPNQDANSELPNSEIPSTNEFDDDLNEDDLMQLVEAEAAPSAQPPVDFSWSEIGSTRRSTPLREDEPTFLDNQDSLLDEFSSPKSGLGKLPNTQPLPSEPDQGSKEPPLVDFSETASTVRRSSPYYSLAASQIGDDEALNILENNPLAPLPSTIPNSIQALGLPPFPKSATMDHLPEDELYDVTPPKSTAELEAETSRKEEEAPEAATERSQRTKKPNSSQNSKTKGRPGKASKSHDALTRLLEEELDPSGEDERQEQASSPPEKLPAKLPKRKNSALKGKETPKRKPAAAITQDVRTSEQRPKERKGRRQRAKTPIQFDEETHEIKEATPRKAAEQQPRMPIVSNLRKSHAASVSPIASAGKGTPGSKRKPALKRKPPAQDASQKAPPATRKSDLKNVVPQDKPHTTEERAVPATKVAAKPAPAINKRITRAKVKEEKAPVSQPSKAQETPGKRNETQGSTQDPIVLSSDPESSLFSDDDDAFVPTEDLQPKEKRQSARKTQSVMGELLVDPIVDVEPVGHAHREKAQPSTRPQTLPQKPEASHPSRPPEEQISRQKTTMTVKPDSKKIVEEPLPSTRGNRAAQKGRREVLSARDTNILVQQDTSQARTLKRPATTVDPIIDVSQPPRKIKEYLSSLAAAEAIHDKTKVGLRPKPNTKVKAEPVNLHPEPSSSDKDLHAQILASLQGQNEATAEVEQAMEHDKVRGNGVSPRQTRPAGPNAEIAEKLHGLVETMLGHLQAKEATIYRGADAYRKNGINCVDKIERRYIQEKQALSKTWKKDSDRFLRGTRAAKAAIDERGKIREKAMQQLNETAARRRHLFQQATTSLRALHGRLMKGKLADYED
ncbi:hypothetical protein BFJ66_g5384 [Fusarium oxysporum f. sp. cepae]|uniref:Uncharacterized protein n=2 Tax=Fusarium oxysporum f. sp. cepae TaxID=396571 RepID=A0A3L6NKQ6_FUSOX|nr:hypothetical protein BFJ65_g8946 [Fusarium oxysporum f. sp. cepae]RKK52967.1 hypothetical protein BFJ66_g5384 [Fusarium oxysporum f. sp. cepae]RKK55833.1 hypothetical protein BFJ67_g4153 [Fusarium oxysporum f. sp. cepae]